MASIGNKLVTKQMEWHANMTQLNHLGRALIAKPEVLGDKVTQMFSSQNLYSDNPLTKILSGNKLTEKYLGSNEWEWKMKGANSRPLVVIEDVEGNSAKRGKFKTTYLLKLDESWWNVGDVISPSASNKIYQSRVASKQPHGTHWVYTMRIMSDNPNDSIPQEYFKPGTQWSKLFAQFGEASKGGGSTTFSTPISLRSRMGKYRKKYRVTDYASTEVLAVGITDSQGNTHKSWMRYADVEYWQQWYRELERGLWYSRSTDSVLDENGIPLRTGPGVQELLEDSHIYKYTHLSARLIEDYLMDIYYGRSGFKSRNTKAYTGEYGMIQYSRAIEDILVKTGHVRNVEVYSKNVKSELHSNAQEYGYQYVRYNMMNGTSLELIHNPLYDDREINTAIDPISGYPYESQRITFLNFAGDGGKSNVCLMKRKDGFAFGYVEGMYSPYGPKKGGMMAHDGEYYEMNVSQVQGIHIGDITMCGELILDRNRQ